MHKNKTPHGANEYDAKVISTLPYYKNFHSETIDLVKIIKPNLHSWLDTGCGTGSMIAAALPSFPDTQFFLADPAEKMLQEAQQRFSEAQQKQITILPPCGSADLCQTFTKKVEVVTAIQSHHYFSKEKREEAVRACYAILAEGGLYITFENIRPLTEQGVQYGLDRWMQFQKREGRSPQDVDFHRSRFGTAYFPITILEHLELLKSSGFKSVELFWYSQMQAGFYAIK